MFSCNRCAKINIKLLVILILVVVAIGTSLFAAREVRRSILSKASLEEGDTAYKEKDWPAVCENYRAYLARNPDDVDILKKYSEACLNIRPIQAETITGAISAYRRVIQLEPTDDIAYEKLAMLYTGIGNFGELAYIAETKLTYDPNDRKAPLWLADALVRQHKIEEAQQTLEGFINELEILPEKQPEYIRACILMSDALIAGSSYDSKTKALEWLNKAITYDPESVEAHVYRARFYRTTPDIPGITTQERMVLAHKDLEVADKLEIKNPRLYLFLGAEWMHLGQLDRVAAQLQAAESFTPEQLDEHFFDINDWITKRFLLKAELTMRRGEVIEGVSLTDEVLTNLTEKGHRAQALPFAIELYIAGGKVSDARTCLDEYVDIVYTQDLPEVTKMRIAYLKALVANAEQRPYVVIDVLQPVLVNESARPEMWRLLAQAYSLTNQPRRAIGALERYLIYYPKDQGMTLLLAREYSKLTNWKKVYETALIAESLNPDNLVTKLLRIESSIYLAAAQGQKMDTESLQKISTELIQLRNLHPDQVGIRILQAVIAFALEQPEKAEKELKLAIEECKEPYRAEMLLANHYNRTERTDEAINVCQAACQNHPETAEPWIFLSNIHAAQADYDSARSYLKQGSDAIDNQQGKRSISIALAMLELSHGDRPTGINILNELAAQDENDIRVRSLLIGTREIQQDQVRVEKLLGELRAAEGERGLWWRLYQARLWLSSNDWRSKQQDITELLKYCIDSDPKWSAPVLLLVGMYERLEDLRRAEDTCRQALVQNPEAADITSKLLAILEQQGRFADAERILQQTETNPQLASAWNIRMALQAGDLSRAIDELKIRIVNDDRDVASRIQLARLIYQQTSDIEQAFRYLDEAEAITPASASLIVAKTSILKAEDRTQEALAILDDYVKKNNDFNAYWTRASYLSSIEGQFECAEQDFKKLTTFKERGSISYELLSNFYIFHGKLDEAIAAIDKGINEYPADIRLKRVMLRTLLLRGYAQDQQKAAEILANLEEQFPQDPELMKLRAQFMLKEPTAQSIQAAKEKLENVIKLEPTAVDAHLALIDIAMQERQYESGRDLAIRALGYNSDNPILLSARGRAELALENNQMAAELANLVLQEDPNNIDALNLLVNAATNSMDNSLLEKARAVIKSSIDKNSKDENLIILLTKLLVAMGTPQNAIPQLEAYCQSQEGGSSIAAHVTLADLYRMINDVVNAQRILERAETIDEKNQLVIHARLLLLASQNNFDELAGISSEYIAAENLNLNMLLTAASVLSSLDSVNLKKEGIKLFEHAVVLAPDLTGARLSLASACYQIGNADKAEKTYRELLEQFPNDIRVLNDLAWILQEHYHRYPEALELADKGLSFAPDNLHLLDTRGIILSNLPDRLNDAKSDFERLVELSNQDKRQQAKAYLQLGRICEKLEDLAQAKVYLEHALEIDREIDVFTPDERMEINNILQKSRLQAVNR